MLSHITTTRSTGVALAFSILAGCGGPGEIQGLPSAEFNRVFLAAIDVSAAEHCGDRVNGALVRSNLVKFQANRGLDPATVSRSGAVFDKVRTEYTSRISASETFCRTDYNPNPERLRQYEKGNFPDVT